MKKTLLIILISVFPIITQTEMAQDKQKHIAVSSIIGGTTYLLARSHGYSKTKSFIFGIVTANVAGLMKEATDSEFDRDDIKHNVIGSFIGTTLVWTF